MRTGIHMYAYAYAKYIYFVHARCWRRMEFMGGECDYDYTRMYSSICSNDTHFWVHTWTRTSSTWISSYMSFFVVSDRIISFFLLFFSFFLIGLFRFDTFPARRSQTFCVLERMRCRSHRGQTHITHTSHKKRLTSASVSRSLSVAQVSAERLVCVRRAHELACFITSGGPRATCAREAESQRGTHTRCYVTFREFVRFSRARRSGVSMHLSGAVQT